ncbi:hypothetical protein SETIT_9G321300v2 [Setaria italica]|uniref:DUF4408 domain-containing protein n=1 Tax=Setaria italica TaxID=4555 RepID=K4A8S0_SETIT|nr:uncharacterized protein LOC101775937 [Setaria italica]RCV43782.1 hypothetical protein SETIT_9G321300v2 [Setaria italica]
MAAQQQAASVLQSFPFRAAVLALCVALLPLLPAAPEAGAGGAGQAFLAKACELLHLLFVGIAVSYGLFSRKNSADDGRAGFAAAEKDAAAGPEAAKADARYAWRMFRDSIAPFDDDDEDEELPDSPPGGGGGGGGREKMRSWSALHRPKDPVVVVSNGGGGRSGHAQAPLSLPVRALKPQPAQDASAGGGGETPRARPRRGSQDPAASGGETVLPSPIPWRSRSGRLDAGRPASPSPSPSPRRLSPASSLARETLAKASEEEYYAKRRSPYRSSSSISSPPPAPPPPPPPFLVHGYHPAVERRTAVAKSFKEELQDHSMRGRGEDHYSPDTSIFSNSAYNSNNNSSMAKPRNSFDGGGGGSSSSASVGKSVRTIRAREPAPFQGQSQELPDDAGNDRDALGVHGLEESYGYRAYQSIPRFQYERSVSDPILGGVAVSSDDTESSDDDDDVGGCSTRTNSPRESTPEVDENEVDKKAEEFIARFREQIRRQRIESIKKSAGPRGVKRHGK